MRATASSPTWEAGIRLVACYIQHTQVIKRAVQSLLLQNRIWTSSLKKLRIFYIFPTAYILLYFFLLEQLSLLSLMTQQLLTMHLSNAVFQCKKLCLCWFICIFSSPIEQIPPQQTVHAYTVLHDFIQRQFHGFSSLLFLFSNVALLVPMRVPCWWIKCSFSQMLKWHYHQTHGSTD